MKMHVKQCCVLVIFVIITLSSSVVSLQIPIVPSDTSISSSSPSVISCSLFKKQNIKLVTVDVFAALTLLDESLDRNIAAILPQLTSDQVLDFVTAWENVYADHLGYTFDEKLSGPHPFRTLMNDTLPQLLSKYNVTVNETQANELVNSWGDLILRPSAKPTFTNLTAAGFHIAPLSNGDEEIVSHAFSALAPEVEPSFVFTSDYPVMCFKHCTAIYQHVLQVSNYSALEVLHVAGSMYDGKGARSAGLFSAVLDPGSHHRNDTYNYPCFVLNDLSDLLDILL
eukprot:TRINITY_DN18448_c0_g1_i1.p1 TRINITY_DN18448_c0_g1~~TRINITY_DN18448_c0_g1_i1.p1  ORF type:complete len:283 (-),score=62.98 TRINITY_DN18448_c0_g1_i1:18-866(-)